MYAQTASNPTVRLESIDIPFEKFNVISSNSIMGEFEHEHSINWQLSIKNHIVYANPLGNAVIQLYDGVDKEKFIEIGMGSPPDRKFWVAVQNPEIGYAVVHDQTKDGWNPNDEIVVVYSSTADLTINNGQRIVVSNLDVGNFEIKDFSVYGMESSTDPPATNSGNLILNMVSGNPAANPLFYLPYILAIGAGALVVVLLKTKKRT
ncbi:MAG TPA: hypothetical protein VLB45_04600 [Nitrosopumilaceae archaeon]|nr:hypothetical protein [Nitrosopumilaceae archaeon]